MYEALFTHQALLVNMANLRNQLKPIPLCKIPDQMDSY